MNELDTVQAADGVAVVQFKGAWQVLVEAVHVWRRHKWTFTGMQVAWAAVLVGAVIVTAIVAGFAMASAGVITASSTGEQILAGLIANPGLLAWMIVLGAVCAAVVVVASSWVSLATIRIWEWSVEGQHERISVRNALTATGSLVSGYIWISVIALALVALGLFGFVLPGIMLMLAFTMLPAVAVVERLKGRNAIMRATTLVRPYLLIVFWRGLVAAVAIYVPGEIGRVVFNAISDGVGDALYQLYSLVVGPVMTGALFLTYREIKSADRKQKYLVWLSLERFALLGAVAAALLITVLLVVRH